MTDRDAAAPGSALTIRFADGRTAPGVRVDRVGDLPDALAVLGLDPPRPVVVVVGGAAGLDRADRRRLRPLFEAGLAPVVDDLDAVVVDGGTRSGVMRVIGEARFRTGGQFPLVGVAAAGTIALVGDRPPRHDAARLDAHHTHFVVVPGATWGAEAPWIAQVASIVAGGAGSVTLVVNGGEIVYADVERSLDAGRPVLVVAGSGRAADELATAVRGDPADDRALALAASALVRVVPGDDPDELARAVAGALTTSSDDRPSAGRAGEAEGSAPTVQPDA